jgi:PPOX class probable F420-dependent enzyme
MPTIPASHADLLETPIAILATSGPDGFPQVSALWFLHDTDGLLKLSLNTSRQKVKNLRLHPACTLFIVDPANPYRTLEIRAQAALSPDDDYAFADRLGRKYGADLRTRDQPGEQRVVVTLRPVKVNTYGGGGGQ